MQKDKPVVAITMGDPAGIGPEIVSKALADERVHRVCYPLVIGEAGVMRRAIEIAGVDLTLKTAQNVSEARFGRGEMWVLHLEHHNLAGLRLGEVSVVAGEAAFQAVKRAIELALAGEVDATVTAPIHKESINLAGHHFAGHTEIYGHYTGTRDFAMLLVDGNLRIMHVSTHVSLRQACDLVKKERVLKVIGLLGNACRQFGIVRPRIAVAGLNPHASDGGLFGDEERREILPAIEAARAEGWQVEGPEPPDTLFPRAVAGFYDGVVAMYHDQGHIPFKVKGFQWDKAKGRWGRISGVNITIGLPIIRTSVDHGTAFEIAGKGIANYESLVHAIEYGVILAQNRAAG